MRKNLSVDELGYLLNAPLLATLATNSRTGARSCRRSGSSGAMAVSLSSSGTTTPRRGRSSAIHV